MKALKSNKNALVVFRKALRNHMTKAEILLWQGIKSSKLCGVKFRRQHSFGNYIVDFYASKIKLAIEIDGNYHQGIVSTKDEIRDKVLKEKDILVVRFSNAEVLENHDGILIKLEEIILKRINHPYPLL